jgi:hypothetical protein
VTGARPARSSPAVGSPTCLPSPGVKLNSIALEFTRPRCGLSVRRPAAGDLLRFDGGAWVGVTAAEILADAGLGDLGDVDAATC